MKKSVVILLFLVFFANHSNAQGVIVPGVKGFDELKETINHGSIDTVTYPSKTVGTNRRAIIYTPTGFTKKKNSPVFYLLHGIGGDEKEWVRGAQPQIILDNLYAEGKIEPMIVVMPNGRAMKDDRAVGNMFDSARVQAFTTFEKDLLNDLIPYIEKKYPVLKTGSTELSPDCRWVADNP